jgi:hypothetical protein
MTLEPSCRARAHRLAALLLLPLFALLGHARAAACDVRLNEICPAPARDWDGDALYTAREDEWVELINHDVVPVDLSAYVITDADSTWRWQGAGMIGPGEHRVVFGSDAVNWQRDNGRGIAGLSLANAGDTVRLWRLEGADTTLVESYTYRPHEAGSDRTIGRHPDATGAWMLFDGLNPYTGALEPPGSGCEPTPHAPNDCNLTPAEASTWGRVKAAYR